MHLGIVTHIIVLQSKNEDLFVSVSSDFESLPSSPYRAYLEESKAPLTSFLFTLPLFVGYHFGVWWINTIENLPWANAADVLLVQGLRMLGAVGPMVSFVVVVFAFLLSQQLSAKPWRLPRTGTWVLMILESLLFALPVFLLSRLTNQVLLSATAARELPIHVNLILSLGAGVYEEFLFRMLLMGLLFVILKRLFRLEKTELYFSVMVIQALLFAAFHHLPGSIEVFRLHVFAFRTLAGIYFAYLYQERGFGIAAGSHACYDLIAVTMNAL